MPSRSWWTNVRELRGTLYRYECTCRRVYLAAERVPHWRRSSQRIWLARCDGLATRQGIGFPPQDDATVCGSGLAVDGQGARVTWPPIVSGTHVVLAQAVARSGVVPGDEEFSRHSIR